MNSLKELVPKHKGDVETALRLTGYPYETVEPIVPELLEWLQDLNWPVAGPVADYLETIYYKITPEIIKVLRSDDPMWKYSCLIVFGNIQPMHPLLLKELKLLVDRITQIEIDNDILELAQTALANNDDML